MTRSSPPPRAKPFAGCGGPTPAALMRLPVAEQARQARDALVQTWEKTLAALKPGGFDCRGSVRALPSIRPFNRCGQIILPA